LQDQLEGTENRINEHRNKYNAAVKDYNLSVRQFPGNITAMIFGFKAKAMFEADANAQTKPKWEYPGYDSIGEEEFTSFMQDYCVIFYQLGTPAGWEAFKSLSEKMLQYYPKNTLFMTNIGSYYLAYKKDSKAALKQYNAVLKIDPNNYSAIKNCVLLARSDKNVKLEKKYLPMLIKTTDNDIEKAQSEGRLNALNSK